MKKITAVILALAMLLSLSLPTLAADDAKSVLESVKARIDVPETLTEFDYSENLYNGVKHYWFSWNDEDYNNSISVSVDEKGHIEGYSTYMRRDSDSKKIIRTTKAEAEKVAYEFLEKVIPEMLEDENDRLILNEELAYTYSNSNRKNFRFVYERIRDGRFVWGNTVSVSVEADGKGIYVSDLYADIDYDAKFEENTAPKALEESYMKEYPAKMIYVKHYGEKEDSIKLVYQIESGFVGNLNGMKLEAEAEEGFARNTMAAAGDSMADSGGASKQVQLTPKEIEELENMGALIDVKELEKKLRDMKELAVTDEMKLSNSYTQKAGNGYRISISLSDNESRYLDASFNAETGELMYVYNYDYSTGSKNVLTDAEKLEAQKKGEEFIKKVAGDKLSETEYEENVENGVRAVRVVNGIKYPANTIRAYYDTQSGFINSYSAMTWEEDISRFPKPDGAMSAEEVYKKVFEKKPLRDVYILSNGVYKCGAALESGMTLDAFTGENIYENENEKPSYDDISGHWAEEIIKTLLDMDIYLDGTSFRPNDEITQGDMLRLFGSVFYYTSFARNKTIDYSWLETYKGVIEKAEIDENASVTREEAFKYFVRMMGFGEVAELDIFADIFKDSKDFEGAIGSAAILKGMGIIASDGYAHPDRNLTRAEAAAMVYNYLDRGAN